MQIKSFQAADDAKSGWQVLQLAKLQTVPQLIYTSSRAEPGLIEQLQQPIQTFSDEESLAAQSFSAQVRLEKASIFSYDEVFATRGRAAAGPAGIYLYRFRPQSLTCFETAPTERSLKELKSNIWTPLKHLLKSQRLQA